MKTEKTRATKNIWLKKKKVLTLANRKRRHNVHLSLLADFLGNRISAAGVSHVIKAPSPLRRTLWAVIILITAMGMAFMTYRVLQEYLAYPTIMRSKDNAVTELEFPAVTVCGMSPIPTLFAKEAGLEYMEEMRSIMSNLPKYSISEENKTRCLKDPLCYWDWFSDFCVCFANPCQTLYCYPDADVSDDKCECSKLMCHWSGSAESCYFGTDSSGMTCCICRTNFTYPLANYWKFIRKECDEESRESCKPEREDLPEDFVEGLDAVNANEQIKEFWTRLKGSRTQDLKDIERFFVPHVSVMDNYGFPMDSIILSCNFGVEECHDFVTLYTPSYGKCYMFNYIGEEAIKNRKVRTVSQPGKQHGLQLFMRSRSNDSLPLFTRQLGVRLIIHDPRSIPVVSEDGIDLRPGDMTTINLEYKEIHRLGPPWGKCAYNGQKLGSYSQDPYKQNDCERECVSAEIYRRCDCYHPRYLRATTVPRRGKVCHTNTSEEDHCFLATMKDNDSGKVKCNCPPACREKTYDMSLSSSKLNENFFKLVKTARSLSVVNGTPAVTNADFGTSLLGVQIHYNSLFSTSINETAIYSWESLVANIGGNMGLFLGLSLVTILEILEFFTDMIYSVFVKRKTRQSKVKVENMSY